MKTLLAALAAVILYCAPALAQDAMSPPEQLMDPPTRYRTAVFAGGCFWCMESDFEDKKGVVKVVSGYTGGMEDYPTYKQVSSGKTGHFEAIEVTYDTNSVDYADLLDIFWQNVDPFDENGQFCDKGTQYRAAIFYRNDREKELARASLAKVEKKFGKKVATSIRAAKRFWPAEDYHQDYHKKSSVSYKYYRFSCGRDKKLEKLWGERE